MVLYSISILLFLSSGRGGDIVGSTRLAKACYRGTGSLGNFQHQYFLTSRQWRRARYHHHSGQEKDPSTAKPAGPADCHFGGSGY